MQLGPVRSCYHRPPFHNYVLPKTGAGVFGTCLPKVFQKCAGSIAYIHIMPHVLHGGSTTSLESRPRFVVKGMYRAALPRRHHRNASEIVESPLAVVRQACGSPTS